MKHPDAWVNKDGYHEKKSARRLASSY